MHKIQIIILNFLILNVNLIFNQIPVIFIHKKDASYLNDTLSQAKQYNERVILIGDEYNEHYSSLGVEHYYLRDFSKNSNYFEKIYKHLSLTAYEFQLICFQRWFILHEFMLLNNIQVSFYADSDQMLYIDINRDYENFKKYDMTICGHGAAMVSYWNIKAITDFCNYVLDIYENKEKLALLEQNYDPKNQYTWVHDDGPIIKNFVRENLIKLKLSMINKNSDSSIIKVGNINEIIDDATFDTVIYWDYQYDAISQMLYENVYEKSEYNFVEIKAIEWANGLPYCYNRNLKKRIRFKSLHLQGRTKFLSSTFRKHKAVLK